MDSMQKAVTAEVNRVVSEIIKPGMSDLEKETAINRYLMETAEYDFGALENAEKNNFEYTDKKYAHSFTPYGVLINKVGVCASYAGAFKLLSEAAGLDAVVVVGRMNGSLPHAWNRVFVDGDWMTIDVTSNDNIIENSLFNVPDYVVSGILVEDNHFLLRSVLATMKGTAENLEWYRLSDKYYPAVDFQSAIARGLLDGESFCIRTDYDMSEEEVVLLLIGAMLETDVTSVEGFIYWLGVIYVSMA
ncbi:MAG: transglutaminase domain-containing protein, partial [Defluviitaleaceae bacterium]|nr:transglutaminase domain-containing protein [Defluviitaleaceae bacterium]